MTDQSVKDIEQTLQELKIRIERADYIERSDPANLTDFEKGMRVMFDALQMRAANHWHGNPEINKQCEEENNFLLDSATDALTENAPELCAHWLTLSELLAINYRQNKTIQTLESKVLTIKKMNFFQRIHHAVQFVFKPN